MVTGQRAGSFPSGSDGLRGGAGPARRIVHHLENVMGTIVVIDVYAVPEAVPGPPDAEIGEQLAEAVAILHRADATFSTWRPDSPVSRLRRGEITSAQVPGEVAEILALCAAARELSAGWFDPWAVPGGFDPSGYVKGWAAQNALGAFRRRASAASWSTRPATSPATADRRAAARSGSASPTLARRFASPRSSS